MNVLTHPILEYFLDWLACRQIEISHTKDWHTLTISA
jgi:hypothetical protein